MDYLVGWKRRKTQRRVCPMRANAAILHSKGDRRLARIETDWLNRRAEDMTPQRFTSAILSLFVFTLVSSMPADFASAASDSLVSSSPTLDRATRALAQGKLNAAEQGFKTRSEEHTSELQSRSDLVCRLLLETEERRVGKECRSRWSPYH